MLDVPGHWSEAGGQCWAVGTDNGPNNASGAGGSSAGARYRFVPPATSNSSHFKRVTSTHSHGSASHYAGSDVQYPEHPPAPPTSHQQHQRGTGPAAPGRAGGTWDEDEEHLAKPTLKTSPFPPTPAPNAARSPKPPRFKSNIDFFFLRA